QELPDSGATLVEYIRGGDLELAQLEGQMEGQMEGEPPADCLEQSATPRAAASKARSPGWAESPPARSHCLLAMLRPARAWRCCTPSTIAWAAMLPAA